MHRGWHQPWLYLICSDTWKKTVFPFHFLWYPMKIDTDKRSESTLLMHYMGAFSQDHKSLPNVC